ncbi:MAG TPA: sigma-54-dependent Fis family transcriptional regulator [Planctomycetes bacterium]|nr:sigma-54-dependent Fis family transcriptional regulator [Planctomycetota bacterium]
MSELVGRLEALISEARDAGELAELAEALTVAAREAARAVDRSSSESDVELHCGMVGESEAMQRVYSLIERVAPSDVPVLVYGETGTGKELVARALHQRSPRAKGPLLALNCAAVSPNLIESELFGHKRGSFTGAVSDRDGHFVAASGGTLFLDEIGDMPLDMQAKLLRALEERVVRPVGSAKSIPVDIRLVAATNRDLAELVEENTFRSDLYYRLNVVTIQLPALRERAGDVALLARFLLGRVSREVAGAPRSLSPEALELLETYPWPGNVRQLENELRRAAALSDGVIGPEDLSPEIQAARHRSAEDG